MRQATRESGFTLIEVTISMAVLIPMLFAALVSQRLLSGSVETNAVASTLDASAQRIDSLLYEFTRPALASSIEGRANPSAAWETPLPATDYQSIRFDSADPLEPTLEIVFTLDPDERENDADDDGDGLVDEGRVAIRRGTSEPWTTIVTGVERFAARFDSRLLTIDLQFGRRDASRRVMRARRSTKVFVRNN